MTTEEIKEAMAVATAEMRSAQDRLADLRALLRNAALADGLENPHPWLGMAVRRTLLTNRRTRVETGVVTLCREYVHYRNYRPRVGEYFVASLSGITAYNLAYGASASVGRWELAQ